MSYEILSWQEMCQREGCPLQRGMHYGLGTYYSVVLMTLRPRAGYEDQAQEHGGVIVYQGHDRARGPDCPEPALVDQPEFTARGLRTGNGKFYCAALEYKLGIAPAERVRIYQKLRPGVWSCNGFFRLEDGWKDRQTGRLVFRFRLRAEEQPTPDPEPGRARAIPPHVRRTVWKRDQGCCVLCGSRDRLHFDHIIPVSKGGSSTTSDNIQLLCERHNLGKSARIG